MIHIDYLRILRPSWYTWGYMTLGSCPLIISCSRGSNDFFFAILDLCRAPTPPEPIRGIKQQLRQNHSGPSRFNSTTRHPEGNPGASLKSISYSCLPILVALVCELSDETIDLPLGCLQGGYILSRCLQIPKVKKEWIGFFLGELVYLVRYDSGQVSLEHLLPLRYPSQSDSITA